MFIIKINVLYVIVYVLYVTTSFDHRSSSGDTKLRKNIINKMLNRRIKIIHRKYSSIHFFVSKKHYTKFLIICDPKPGEKCWSTQCVKLGCEYNQCLKKIKFLLFVQFKSARINRVLFLRVRVIFR